MSDSHSAGDLAPPAGNPLAGIVEAADDRIAVQGEGESKPSAAYFGERVRTPGEAIVAPIGCPAIEVPASADPAPYAAGDPVPPPSGGNGPKALPAVQIHRKTLTVPPLPRTCRHAIVALAETRGAAPPWSRPRPVAAACSAGPA